MIAQDLLSRFYPANDGVPSKTLNVAVLGAGPAGLLLSWKLLNAGHKVSVFEKRGAYQLNQEPDARSYNLTADGLGLRAFGNLANLIYCAGSIVDGRAIHSFNGALWTHPYGYRPTDYLVSIPRGDLLALLTATIINHPNCKLHFDTQIEKSDVSTNQGTICYRDNSPGFEECQEVFDLIAFADGVRGIGQQKAKNQAGVNSICETEDMPYLKVTISKEAAIQEELVLNKIHFFPAEDSLAIGLPNFGGTISLLIEGIIHKNYKEESICPFTGKAPFSFGNPAFVHAEEAVEYLKRQNPKLGRALPDFSDQIVNVRPGHFIESFITRWRVGTLGVLVGDAGSCAPPWAGFGMNLACSHAADLAELIDRSDDLESALDRYNKRRQKCTEVVKKIIRAHGALLNGGIGSRIWRREQALREQRERMLGERSEYQIVAFEERGLEDLAGLD